MTTTLLLFFRAFRTTNAYSTKLFGSKKEYVPDIKSLSKFYKPKSANQELYNKCLNDDLSKIVFSVGPAGTGKTLLACNAAIRDLKRGKFQKIIITRPVVPVEEDIGFLPGNLVKKMDPWTRPIFDIFLEFYSQKDIDSMMQANTIEISPLAYMRGRTFKNAFIIADEMQNSSPNQMLMLTTRIGIGSKMVITGDLNQTDRGLTSGLSDFMKKYKTYQRITNPDDSKNQTRSKTGIEIVELDASDIAREPIISTILDIYNADEIGKRIYSPPPVAAVPEFVFESRESILENNLKNINQDAALIPKKDFLRNGSAKDTESLP
jgi:phosphate starvation-inducible PhoH-like protein